MSDLEYVNAHTLPCGCVFLLAWPETRYRHEKGHLVDTHDPAVHGDKQHRVVTRDEAETVVELKRQHDDWQSHVVPAGNQPAHRLCAKHANMTYGADAYAQICAENR